MTIQAAIQDILHNRPLTEILELLIEGDREEQRLRKQISMGDDEESVAHLRAMQVRSGEVDPRLARALDALDAVHKRPGDSPKWFILLNAVRLANQAILYTAGNRQEMRVVYMDTVGAAKPYSNTPALRAGTDWIRLHVIREGQTRGREGSYDTIEVVGMNSRLKFRLEAATATNPSPRLR